MNINWHNIRPINGDQKEGFEEFVCQLARKESIPDAKHFIRKGKPDSGVECYWILDDNSEWAWQAKYFTASLKDTQWKQIEKSVKTAIKNHKNLKRYYISMPIDPPDGKRNSQKSMLAKWHEHNKKWQAWAKKANLNIEFLPWWSSDLIERLQKPENAGFIKFWFDNESFTDEWFKEKIKYAIGDLGNRYSPEINVELDIVKIFDGIAKDEKFIQQFHNGLDVLLIKIKDIRPEEKDKKLSHLLLMLNNCTDYLKKQYEELIEFKETSFDFKPLLNKSDELREILLNLESCILNLTKNEKEKNLRTSNSFYYITQCHIALRKFEEFIDSSTVKLFNTPYLLLNGEAGIGKSHLLADISNIRLSENKFSLLLLGQHFYRNDDPKIQILKRLDLNCTFDEFLEGLSCKAQISGSRIIIFIDAINEGDGKELWPDCLTGFVKQISKYKWLGVVFSIRTSYIELFRENINNLNNDLIHCTHYGFKNVEYEASKIFFKNYNIELPSVPLLHPEFQNPLFLKLFCDGLKKAGYVKIPNGLNGITEIFNFFIESINNKLSSPKTFNYSSGINIVKKAIHNILQHKLKNKSYYTSIDEAGKIISELQKAFNITGNLLDALISEGIFSKNLYWKENNKYVEGIYITYEKLEDHLIVSELLDKITKNDINIHFQKSGLLFDYVKDIHTIHMNVGIIEALSIQLPERYDIELHEMIDNSEENYEIANAFVNSLLWRKNGLVIKEQTHKFINNSVYRFEHTYKNFWDTIIAVSINPDHYFNANLIHEKLFKYSLADRDEWWTQLIFNWYSNESSLKRLIDWAWSIEDKSHVKDDSILLASIMLSWFFVSTNRRLRDCATKALICLLENRIHLIIDLLKKFENVNDPYIYERIFCVAYGCTLRNNSKNHLKELSEYIYETIFNKDKVYPHVLLRDYARGVIEYTLYSDITLNNIDETRIRPPYKSNFPQIPPDSEIKKYRIDYNSKDFKDHYWSINAILNSMEVDYSRNGRGGGYGDFGRYIFQGNFYNWQELNPIDLKNIAIKRIFELGYNVEKHGHFDHNVRNENRHYVVNERIGKKYQWIAMHELLAQVADNFQMRAPWSGWGEDKKLIYFNGPWEPFVRDIDPSTIQKIEKRSIVDIEVNINYSNWREDNKKWLKYTSDLPDPVQFIEDKTKKWTLLEGHISRSNEEHQLGHERYSIPYKQFWYVIRSYLIKNDQFDSINKWLSYKNFSRTDLPESNSKYEIFNREYFWSPAFKDLKNDYYGGDYAQSIYDRKYNKKIGDVIVSAERYFWEAQYDLSKDEVFQFLKPCSILVEKLKLHYKSNESYMYSPTGDLVCFDSAEVNKGYPRLYFNKSILIDFLKANDYRIIWTVLCEKNILGDYGQGNYGNWPVVYGVYTLTNKEVTGGVKQYPLSIK